MLDSVTYSQENLIKLNQEIDVGNCVTLTDIEFVFDNRQVTGYDPCGGIESSGYVLY